MAKKAITMCCPSDVTAHALNALTATGEQLMIPCVLLKLNPLVGMRYRFLFLMDIARAYTHLQS